MSVTFAGVGLTLPTPEVQAVVDSLWTPRQLWPFPPRPVRVGALGIPCRVAREDPPTTLGLLRWPVAVSPEFGTYLAVVPEATWRAIYAMPAFGGFDRGVGDGGDALGTSFGALKLTVGAVTVTAYMGLVAAYRLTRVRFAEGQAAQPGRLLVFADVRYALGNHLRGVTFPTVAIGDGRSGTSPRTTWQAVVQELAADAVGGFGVVADYAGLPTAPTAGPGSGTSLVGPSWRMAATRLGDTLAAGVEPFFGIESAAAASRRRTVLTPTQRLSFPARAGLAGQAPIAEPLVGRPARYAADADAFTEFPTVAVGAPGGQPCLALSSLGHDGFLAGQPELEDAQEQAPGFEASDGHINGYGGVHAGLVAAPAWEGLREVRWLYTASTCQTNLLPVTVAD